MTYGLPLPAQICAQSQVREPSSAYCTTGPRCLICCREVDAGNLSEPEVEEFDPAIARRVLLQSAAPRVSQGCLPLRVVPVLTCSLIRYMTLCAGHHLGLGSR